MQSQPHFRSTRSLPAGGFLVQHCLQVRSCAFAMPETVFSHFRSVWPAICNAVIKLPRALPHSVQQLFSKMHLNPRCTEPKTPHAALTLEVLAQMYLTNPNSTETQDAPCSTDAGRCSVKSNAVQVLELLHLQHISSPEVSAGTRQYYAPRHVCCVLCSYAATHQRAGQHCMTNSSSSCTCDVTQTQEHNQNPARNAPVTWGTQIKDTLHARVVQCSTIL